MVTFIPQKGRRIHWALKALVPTSITMGSSFIKALIIDGVNIYVRMERIEIIIVHTCAVNTVAFLTLSYSLAP